MKSRAHFPQNLRDGVSEEVEVRQDAAVSSEGSFDAIYVTMTPRPDDSEGGGGGHGGRHRRRRRRNRRSRLRSRSSENDLPPAYPGHVGGDSAEDDSDSAKEGDGSGGGRGGSASPPPSYEQCFPGGAASSNLVTEDETANGTALSISERAQQPQGDNDGRASSSDGIRAASSTTLPL